MGTLDFLYLSRLINDPIHHDPSWPAISVKLPSNIPKFDGKPSEDPKNHAMTFHLWCSSNSLMDGVSAKNCSQTTKEQANTISKVKSNKIGFRVLFYGFGFKIFISKEKINIHKLIQN